MHENQEASGTSRSNQDRDRPREGDKPYCGQACSRGVGPALVPVNLPNKEEQSSAEAEEGRARAKENIAQFHTSLTQSWAQVSQGLRGVRQAARARKQERFTALLQHVTVDLLRDSFLALQRHAAPGADGVTGEEYETRLEDRLIDRTVEFTVECTGHRHREESISRRPTGDSVLLVAFASARP